MTPDEPEAMEGRIVRREDLESQTADAMYALFQKYFAQCDRGVFDSDLAAKDRVILIYASGNLVGFSTAQTCLERINGKELPILFSGDTIVDRAHWGSGILERCWLKLAVETSEQYRSSLYWFLICSGYRTYRYLPTFFKEFWPRHDSETPPTAQDLLDTLAERRFGVRYRGGVVHLQGGGALREGVSPVDDKLLRNPDIAFFVKANPGHWRGDELACVTRIAFDNLTPAGRRVWRRVTGE